MNFNRLVLSSFVLLFCMFSIVPAFASDSHAWDVSDTTFEMDFTCTSGCEGTTLETMEIGEMILGTGIFTGTGFDEYNPFWTVTGVVSGNQITFTILIEDRPDFMAVAHGTIARDGSISGTAEDSDFEYFTFQSTSGAAEFIKLDRDDKHRRRFGFLSKGAGFFSKGAGLFGFGNGGWGWGHGNNDEHDNGGKNDKNDKKNDKDKNEKKDKKGKGK